VLLGNSEVPAPVGIRQLQGTTLAKLRESDIGTEGRRSELSISVLVCLVSIIKVWWTLFKFGYRIFTADHSNICLRRKIVTFIPQINFSPLNKFFSPCKINCWPSAHCESTRKTPTTSVRRGREFLGIQNSFEE